MLQRWPRSTAGRAIAGITVVVVLVAGCAPAERDATERDATEHDQQPPAVDEPLEETDAAEVDETPAVEEPDEPAIDLSVELTLVEVAQLSAAIAGSVGPDGSLWIADRAGTVHRLTPQGAGPAVIDVSGDTTTDSERGLLGIAFAEDGSELYVSRTDLAGDTVLEAFGVVDGEPDPDQQRTILSVGQPRANHNGGDVQVGPDGMVYLALGDGGGAGDPLGAGQDLSTPLGALLRIDPSTGESYVVPGDNPFVGVDDAVDEIFVYGLRNPWRFSFDRETGELWIADVGQNDREEINVLDPVTEAGANLGWNLMEGTLEYTGSEPEDHHPPVHEYETTSSRCSITGGFVYRGERIPELDGAYLFSDFCEGTIRAIVVDGGEVVDEADLGLHGGQVVSFAEDADGELYVLALGGTVHRIDPA